MSKINPITGTPDRSTEVYTETGKPAMKTLVEADVLAKPLGTVVGDPRPGYAQNARMPTAIFFARNLSNKVERKVLKGKAVSAAQQVPEKVKAKFGMDGEAIKDAINMGRADFNEYEYKISPVHKKLMADSQTYLIPASEKEGEAGPWVPIPESLYELWLGSWERRHALNKDGTPDTQVRREESTRLANSISSSVVFEEGTDRPELAYIEMKREEIITAPIAADREMVYAGVKIEV